MTTIQLADAARWFKGQPHQIAAWNQLQTLLTPQQLSEFAELYRAAPEPKKPLPAPWVAPSTELIRKFESCRLEAYQDASGVPTIGWGTTRYLDAPVRMSDKVSQSMADELLANDVEFLFGPWVIAAVPAAASWPAHQVAALTSVAYNIGLAAFESSTLLKRLRAGEDRVRVVREELPKWVHAGEAVLPGLERRRAAEVALFCGPALQQPGGKNPLVVPYYSQRDSQVAGQANRMCFSSSCAMLVAKLRPGALAGANADDQYLQRVLQFGDTTDAAAQIKALASYGIKARFRQDCWLTDLERQIARGVPVPCGFLHHGPSSAPTGGGHWLLVIGTTASAVIVNDPWGEMDVAGGTYISTKGAGLAYSHKNWAPRWMVEGPGTGWAIMAEP